MTVSEHISDGRRMTLTGQPSDGARFSVRSKGCYVIYGVGFVQNFL